MSLEAPSESLELELLSRDGNLPMALMESLEAPSESLELELLSRDGNLPMTLIESHLHMEGKSMKAAVFHDRGRDDIEMKEMAMTYGENLLLVVLMVFVVSDGARALVVLALNDWYNSFVYFEMD